MMTESSEMIPGEPQDRPVSLIHSTLKLGKNSELGCIQNVQSIRHSRPVEACPLFRQHPLMTYQSTIS